MVNLTKFIAEFIGTFIFIGVILASGQPIPIGIGLIAVIYLLSNITGGHVNPAVTVTAYAAGNISGTDAVTYIVGQILGGICALAWYKHTHKN